MSRQEDFEKAAEDYCEDHSHCIYFEAGAEYGYQYAVEKACEYFKHMKDCDFYEDKEAQKKAVDDFIDRFRKAMEE